MSRPPPAIAAVLKPLPDPVRGRLLELRDLIMRTAAETECVGALIETLKWNEPAYLAKAPRIGTTIRLNAVKGSARDVALYVNCKTDLVATYKAHYPHAFRYEGTRAIIMDAGEVLPELPLAHCIALALTYHLRARTRR